MRDGIGSQKNQNVSVFFRLVGVGNRSGRINQSQSTFPRFVIGLVLPLLLLIGVNRCSPTGPCQKLEKPWKGQQSNLSTMATLGTEERGRCRKVAVMGR